MSKSVDSSHQEWREAMRQLIGALDMSNAHYLLIQSIIEPSLGKVFWADWKAQDAVNPELFIDPSDDSGDPAWWQIDGVPSVGGTFEEVMVRKWRQRASIWCQLFGPHAWHVVDWLIFSKETSAPWLCNLDADGSPKKLSKCQSLSDLVRESNKGLRHRGSAVEVQLEPGDEAVVANLGAGHFLVELMTARALRKEGQRMHHCIGHGPYDGHLLDPGLRLLSVRNEDGKPIATLEIKGGLVRQFRAACNENPSSAILELVSAVADTEGWAGLAEAARSKGYCQRRSKIRPGGGVKPGHLWPTHETPGRA